MRRSAPLLALASAVALVGCGSEPPAVATARPAAAVVEQPAPTTAPPAPPVAVVGRGDGDLQVVPGGTSRSGPGAATTYVVEVEGGLGVDAAAFAAQVDRTLADPRSWGAGGRRRLQRVDDAAVADVRITLASPGLTDRLCAPLRTAGYYSCANGSRAVVNLGRWLRGAPSYAGHLEDYRSYVINHEVGHTLGFGHAACPGRGRPAPVMLQQSKGLDGCTRGPWPYP